MQVTCQRCGTINEFHVIESGPHLKAICDNCGRYIKFVSKNLIINKNEKMNQQTWGAPAPQPTAQKEKTLAPIRLFPAHPNAPDFVLASGVIGMDEFFNFVQANPQFLTEYNGAAQLKFQILRSKEGKLYTIVDEFKPTAASPVTRTWGGNAASPSTQQPYDDKLPF